MATMAPRDVAKLVLVGPMGIKPPEGDIFDQAIVSYIDYARAGFHDQKAFDKIYGAEPSTDQLEAWDIAREMCFRIAWKPYMYSQTPAASAEKREGAGPHRLGRQRQDRSRLDGEALPGGAAERQARGHRGLRSLRGSGAAGEARQARHAVHRRLSAVLHPTGDFACT
jgi:hypothetical protein